MAAPLIQNFKAASDIFLPYCSQSCEKVKTSQKGIK